MNFSSLVIVLVCYMFFLWLLRPVFKNDGLVDFGWPSSFTILAMYYLFQTPDINLSGALYCCLFIACGIRFMVGWIERTIKHGEDPRWELWRSKWKRQEGLFGVKNVSLNFLVFYMVQQFANLTLIAFSLHLNTSRAVDFSLWHLAGLILWIVSLILESWADYDLWRFKKDPKNKGKVCEKNLWYYSRHPNYFFELTIWVAYVIYSWPAASRSLEYFWSPDVDTDGLLVFSLLYWNPADGDEVPSKSGRSLCKLSTDNQPARPLV